MKKAKVIIALVLSICLILTGCSSGSESETNTQGNSTTRATTKATTVESSPALSYPDPVSFFNCEYEVSEDETIIVMYSDCDLTDAVSAYISLASDYGFSFINAADTLKDDFSSATGYILAYNGSEESGEIDIHNYGYMESVKKADGDYCDAWLMSIVLYQLQDFEIDSVDAYQYSNSGNTATATTSATTNATTASTTSSTAATSKLLTSEIAEASAKPTSDAMDLLYYAQEEMSFGDESTGGTHVVRDFSGTASDYDVLYAYVEVLCDNYEFELAAEPYYVESGKYIFAEFLLNYTGSKKMIAGGIDGVYTDGTGDIMIYIQVKRDSLKGAIWYDTALEMGDDGYVYGSSEGGASYIGESFSAGLYQLSNGSYQTTDGRFNVFVGEAMLITDGTATTYNAEFVYDNDDNRQEITAENRYGTEQLVIYIPTTVTLKTDQIFDSSYFIIDLDYSVQHRGISSTVPPYTWTAMVACLHDSDYIYPVRGLSGVMTGVNVRVMYADDDVAVFYACMQFETEPYQVEALIAVGIGTDTVAENQPDDEYTISVGQYVEITGPSVYGAGYNLWEWEIMYGDTYVDLTGDVAQTCMVSGISSGEARVKVTYSYSVKEADVLTGIERSVSHSTTREYVITVK